MLPALSFCGQGETWGQVASIFVAYAQKVQALPQLCTWFPNIAYKETYARFARFLFRWAQNSFELRLSSLPCSYQTTVAESLRSRLLHFVGKGRLELPCLAASRPKRGASTNFATCPTKGVYREGCDLSACPYTLSQCVWAR